MRIPEDLPTPLQLRRLTLVGASSGRERSILRTHANKPGYYYGLDEYDVEPAYEDEVGLGVRHSIGMRVVRSYFQESQQTGWRLEYASSYHTGTRLGNLSAVTRYRFEWTPEETRLAKRFTHFALKGSRLLQTPDIETILDKQLFYVPEDAADINGSEYSFSQVTAADCEQLTEDIAQYYEQAKQSTPR